MVYTDVGHLVEWDAVRRRSIMPWWGILLIIIGVVVALGVVGVLILSLSFDSG